MRITQRQLRRIIQETVLRLNEDSIDSELDHLRKNVHDDIEHIRDLKDDIKDEHEEELKAEKAKEKNEGIRRQLQRIIRATLREDKSGKGACPKSGCIKKSGDKWRIISNKTGKLWPQHYNTKADAENALQAYHVRN